MKKLLFIPVVLCIVQTNGFSQSVFTLDAKKDISIGVVSLGLGITPFLIQNKPERIPENPNENGINSFDRSLMFHYNRPLDIASDYGVSGLMALPLISLMPNIHETGVLVTYGVMFAQIIVCTYGTTFSLKSAIIRYRPYMYKGGVPGGKGNDYYNSFPSGAAAWAFADAAFLSTTFVYEFPESKWKLPVIIGSYTLAAGASSLRIVAGSHFLTDVLAGAAIGSLYGWLIPALHLRKDDGKLSIIPSGNGLFVSLKF